MGDFMFPKRKKGIAGGENAVSPNKDGKRVIWKRILVMGAYEGRAADDVLRYKRDECVSDNFITGAEIVPDGAVGNGVLRRAVGKGGFTKRWR